jgi:hypothetical protein
MRSHGRTLGLAVDQSIAQSILVSDVPAATSDSGATLESDETRSIAEMVSDLASVLEAGHAPLQADTQPLALGQPPALGHPADSLATAWPPQPFSHTDGQSLQVEHAPTVGAPAPHFPPLQDVSPMPLYMTAPIASPVPANASPSTLNTAISSLPFVR